MELYGTISIIIGVSLVAVFLLALLGALLSRRNHRNYLQQGPLKRTTGWRNTIFTMMIGNPNTRNRNIWNPLNRLYWPESDTYTSNRAARRSRRHKQRKH